MRARGLTQQRAAGDDGSSDAVGGLCEECLHVIVVVAEMFIGSTDGLGNRVFEAQQLFAMPDMYAAIFAAGALGYGLNLLFLVVERRYVHWSGK